MTLHSNRPLRSFNNLKATTFQPSMTSLDHQKPSRDKEIIQLQNKRLRPRIAENKSAHITCFLFLILFSIFYFTYIYLFGTGNFDFALNGFQLPHSMPYFICLFKVPFQTAVILQTGRHNWIHCCSRTCEQKNFKRLKLFNNYTINCNALPVHVPHL